MSALRLMLHRWTPRALVRQQATDPELPQVEMTTHRRTVARQAAGSAPAFAARRITPIAHRRYARWLGALAQSHAPTISALTAATAWRSVHVAGGKVVDVVDAAAGRTTTTPVMPSDWCGMQWYGNVPAKGN